MKAGKDVMGKERSSRPMSDPIHGGGSARGLNEHAGNAKPGTVSLSTNVGGKWAAGGGSSRGLLQKSVPAMPGRSGTGRESGSDSGSGGGHLTKAMGK